VLKEAYYSFVAMMEANSRSVPTPPPIDLNETLAQHNLNRNEFINLWNESDIIDVRGFLRPAKVLEAVLSPISRAVSNLNLDSLCAFQQSFNCRGFHKGDCVGSLSVACASNASYVALNFCCPTLSQYLEIAFPLANACTFFVSLSHFVRCFVGEILIHQWTQ
jgi:hypothetical protein